MPYDFNNDGVPDVSTNGDYDGDGVIDYGFPGGTDYWLNTTIPLTFPAPYAGRMVSVYIGPVQRPVARGLDVARFYLDQDGSVATGYSVGGIGADYLVEVDGKEGRILDVRASRFNGTNPGEWAWTGIGPASAAKDRSRIEATVAGVAVTNASLGFFELTSWSGSHDDTSPAVPLPGPAPAFTFQPSAAPTPSPSNPGRLKPLDISGNQQWFFTNTVVSGMPCTLNRGASTMAGGAAQSQNFNNAETGCWYTPAGQPASTVSGVWEVILDISKNADGTVNLHPNANGATNGWTISNTGICTSEANEYQCVSDDPNDGDTTYIKDASASTVDSLYNIEDWSSPPSPLSITSVEVEASCRKTTNSIQYDVRVILKSGANTYLGGSSPNCPNNVNYKVWSDTWTTDPSDGLAWTLTDINALQVGVRDNDAISDEVRVSHVRAIVSFVPVYSVAIDKCTVADCSTFTNLYTSSNSNTFGNDVTFTTGTIGAQTLGGSDRLRFKVTVVAGGTVTINYNAAYPGTSDSRATVPIPEFHEVAIPIALTFLLIPVTRRFRSKRHASRRIEEAAG